ncbi:uncharacterized protein LOC132903420 [Amyelois transitella]|uniref:uncharacterized protein LOC132903420 n=1 Tax=Amyelois transitella TaxID=680683 RepID=UPI00298FB9A7|nr:uncharacterized protein LOC132903420 [Amyelois transitella]
MGKRKHKDCHSRKRREKRRRYSDSSTSSTEDERGQNHHNSYHYENPPRYYSEREPPRSPDIDYEYPNVDDSDASSGVAHEPVVDTVPTTGNELSMHVSGEPQPGPSSTLVSTTPSGNTDTGPLPTEILEALGDPKSKEEVFGPKIPKDISIRWGRILVDGLTKDQKQSILEKSLIPDNFRLAKAPILNPELTPVLNEQARNRDKALEKSQKQLGVGISRLTNLASSIIEGNSDKIELLRQVSEASQIFLDLHYEDTKRRRKLVASSLDKKFLNMITDVKRDTFLFGTNLGEKIKASKTAERSGLQIKRNDAPTTSYKRYNNQGNARGPPRSMIQRAYRQGGQKNRYQTSNRRALPPARDRQPRAPAKPTDKNSKAQ